MVQSTWKPCIWITAVVHQCCTHNIWTCCIVGQLRCPLLIRLKFLPNYSYIQMHILQGWTVGITCQSALYHTSKVSLLYNITLLLTYSHTMPIWFSFNILFENEGDSCMKRLFFCYCFFFFKSPQLYNSCSTLQHKDPQILTMITCAFLSFYHTVFLGSSALLNSCSNYYSTFNGIVAFLVVIGPSSSTLSFKNHLTLLLYLICALWIKLILANVIYNNLWTGLVAGPWRKYLVKATVFRGYTAQNEDIN